MTIKDIREILRTYTRRYRQTTVDERITECRRLRVLFDPDAPAVTPAELRLVAIVVRQHVPDITAEQIIAMASPAALDGGMTLAEVAAAVEAGFTFKSFDLAALTGR